MESDLVRYQTQWGQPPPVEKGQPRDRNDVRSIIAETLHYLGENRERMKYPRYRKAGLPTTSSLVESLVGEVNARVKSKQKYWNRPSGAESILQLRAAWLSEDERFARFWANRPGNPYCKPQRAKA